MHSIDFGVVSRPLLCKRCWCSCLFLFLNKTKHNKIGHLLLSTTTLKEVVAMWGSVSSPK